MDRTNPLEGLEQARCAAIVVDEDGVVQLCNEAAACLLHVDADQVVGHRCWKVTRFRTPDDAPFCTADCPIQREARGAGIDSVHTVSTHDDEREIELLTVPISSLIEEDEGHAVHDDGRQAVLHLMVPKTEPAKPKASPSRRSAASRLGRLSPRERQVLHLIADGIPTPRIAERLYISRTTVRNHVQSILRKLEVHRRLDAILVLMRGRRRRSS